MTVHNKTGAKNRESINLPSIAILVPVSSKDVSFTSFNETLPLFATLLPSLVQSLDCGFRYIAVVGYPEHDHFYDSQQVRIVAGDLSTSIYVSSVRRLDFMF